MRQAKPFIYFIFSCALVLFPFGTNIASAQIYFDEAVAPILRKNCIACHNTKLAEGGLNLESLSTISKGGDSGAAIDKASVDKSLILERAISTDPDTMMPPKGNTVGAERLSTEQVKVIRDWIVGGAQSKGSATPKTDLGSYKLPESAKASYALAVSPHSDFVAFGRGGRLVIHNTGRLMNPKESEINLETVPYQVIEDAHPDFIHSIAISNDGQRIATGSTGQVKIWKCTSETPESIRNELENAAIPISHLFCTSNDASLFATLRKRSSKNADPNSPSKGVITILNRNGEIVNAFDVNDANFACAAWSPSNQKLFAIGADRGLYCWNIQETANAAAAIATLPYDVRSLVAIDETTLLVLADKKAYVWRMKDGATIEQDVEHPLTKALQSSGAVDFVAMSSDRSKLASATQDDQGTTTLKLWNVPQAKLIGTWERDRRFNLEHFMADRIYHRVNASLERSKAGVTELEKALQAEENAVKNAQTNKEKTAEALTKKEQERSAAVQAMMDHEKSIADAQAAVEAAMKKLEMLKTELEPKKKTVADLEKQKSDAQTAMENATQTLAASQESQKSAQARLEEKKKVVIHQTDELAKVKSENEAAKARAENIKFSISAIAFADNHTLAAISNASSAGNDTSIDVFATDSLERTDGQWIKQKIRSTASLMAILAKSNSRVWRLEHQWDSPRIIVDRVTALAFSPDNSKLAIGSGIPSRNGQLAIVQLADGKAVQIQQEKSEPDSDAISLHSDTILGLAYSPDGKWMASCGADKMTKLLDAQTYKVAKIFEGHTHHVLALSWQDTAHRIATASADATVKVWDIEKGEAVRTITGFGTEVTSLAFVGMTPNVATSSMNNLVRLYDADSGKQAKQFSPASDSLYSVAVTPNGKYTLSAGQEGIVRIWKNDDGKLISEWK